MLADYLPPQTLIAATDAPRAWEPWVTFVVLSFVLANMLRRNAPADMLLWGGAVLLTVVGVIDVQQMVSGFASPGLLMVAALFVVSAAMRETGALDRIGGVALGKAETESAVLARLTPQIAGLSAFLNNTAVVAMFVPVVSDWCRKHRISPSRLLMTISFLSILGGMCTLIGTSTNLIASSLMVEAGMKPLAMFELAWTGVPAVLLGGLYLMTVARRIIPDRTDMLEDFGKGARNYVVDVKVEPHCALIGKTIAEAGLRRLPGLFLIEINRSSRLIAPVEPDQTILAGDRMRFAGVVSTIVDLERIPGLVHATDEIEDETSADRVQAGDAQQPQRRHRLYCEAVISPSSEIVGANIRESNFRARYNAAVVAVHRGGRRVYGKLGDIVLREGDTLLLQTGPNFVEANRNNPDFLLVSSIEEARPVRHERVGLALSMLVLLIGLLVFGRSIGIPPVVATFVVGGLMIITRCISLSDARRAPALDVLLTIAAAFGFGAALDESGLAAVLAEWILDGVHLAGFEGTGEAVSHAALAALIFTTMLLSALVQANATAVLMFPLALEIAAQMQADARPFAIGLMLGAAASFATPISYQTNLMVYGPGGYRLLDFVRVGTPLNLILLVLGTLLIPMIWPLHPA